MEINPCPNNDGKHEWRYTGKANKRGNRPVRCLVCKRTAQESPNGIKFTTVRNVIAIKTVCCSIRTDEQRKAEIMAAGYKSINQFVNLCPVIQMPHIS